MPCAYHFVTFHTPACVCTCLSKRMNTLRDAECSAVLQFPNLNRLVSRAQFAELASAAAAVSSYMDAEVCCGAPNTLPVLRRSVRSTVRVNLTVLVSLASMLRRHFEWLHLLCLIRSWTSLGVAC